MNIINTRFSPPRRAFINPRGTATKQYRYNPKTKRLEPVNDAAKRAERKP